MMNRTNLAAILILVLIAHCLCGLRQTLAESALSLLSGFDTQRIESVYPPVDNDSTGELAKLIYRLRNVDSQSLESRIEVGLQLELGDAVRTAGIVESIRTMDVPANLIPVLDMSKLVILTITDGATKLDVVVESVDPKVRNGDRVDGIGVAIELNGEHGKSPASIAVSKLRWFPQQVPNAGWQLLRDAGVDLSLVSGLSSRDRRPLVAADGDAFYSMLAAADSIGSSDDLPVPTSIEPLQMLRQPNELSGQWIQVELETVQITRVFVTELDRKAQLGRDHYFQIDAVGDLGNVVVKIESTSDDGPPALFEGRYPISVVTPELPEFLQKQMVATSGNDFVVTGLRTKISVDAFFFRLWSYQSDFMNQHGGGNQFGPLLVAARIANREPEGTAVDGLGLIGAIAATTVIAGIVITFLWHRKTTASDRAIRKRQQAKESERLDFPSDST